MRASAGSGSEAALRLFYAALPDAAVADHIAAAADALPLPTPAAGLVRRQNWHMTLAFVGELPASQLPVLVELGRAQRIERFSVRFDTYEYWPKPEVVVAAARAVPPALQLLWQQLHRGLAVHLWALDPKRLRPHITLARKVAEPPVLPAMAPFEWPVGAFSLMRSDTSASRSAYTVVDTWSLLDNAAKT